MARTMWRTAVPGLIFALAACSEASAAWVGDRYFPSTLATTVPTPADFFNPPSLILLPETAATTPTREIDIPTTESKLITKDWAVIFTETFRILEQANAPTRSGFDNFVIGTQYALYTNPEHQFIFTVGGTAAIGGTGSSNVSNAFSTLTPTVYLGKGFGDLPESMAWLRPVNVTANFGVAVPTQSSTLTTATSAAGVTTFTQTINPNVALWSFALEYTLLTTTNYGNGKRYPQGWVPVVEFAFQTPLDGPNAGLTTGTVNPGLIWVNRYLQFAAGAVFPVNAGSGRGVGARAQIHFYLSEIFPDTLGKPIFGN
jgi:hypothetical protein